MDAIEDVETYYSLGLCIYGLEGYADITVYDKDLASARKAASLGKVSFNPISNTEFYIENRKCEKTGYLNKNYKFTNHKTRQYRVTVHVDGSPVYQGFAESPKDKLMRQRIDDIIRFHCSINPEDAHDVYEDTVLIPDFGDIMESPREYEDFVFQAFKSRTMMDIPKKITDKLLYDMVKILYIDSGTSGLRTLPFDTNDLIKFGNYVSGNGDVPKELEAYLLIDEV